MKTTNQILTGVAATAGGVIGLAIIGDIVGTETYDPALNETGTFETGTISASVLNYIVPLLALGLLASAVTVYRFS